MYAIVDFKGTQFKVEKDQKLRVPFLKNLEAGAELKMDRILLIQNGEDTTIGFPAVENATVIAEVLGHKKDKKVIVFKKKRRKTYEKKQGHRQNFTEILIKEITN